MKFQDVLNETTGKFTQADTLGVPGYMGSSGAVSGRSFGSFGVVRRPLYARPVNIARDKPDEEEWEKTKKRKRIEIKGKRTTKKK